MTVPDFRQWIRSIAFRVDEKYHDWSWSIHTYDLIEPDRLGLGPESIQYSAAPYSVLRRILKALPPSVREGAFLDYGCGMGRAVIAACRSGFSQAIGVEFSEHLCDIARRNARGLPVEIVQADATLYRVPPEVSVFFFYNPFHGRTLTQVVDRIEDSLIQADRPMVIVYYMRRYFEEAIQDRHWILRGEVVNCHYHKGSWAIYKIDRKALIDSRCRASRGISPE